MDDDLGAEIAGTKAYILTLCSAIGGLEDVIQEDGSVGQMYCVGDEALGTWTNQHIHHEKANSIIIYIL